MKKALLLLCGLSASSWAKDFAHCELANKQLKMLNDYLEPDLRVRASQALIKDIELLRPHIIKNTSGLPDKLIQLCYDIKRTAFQATFVKGGPALYGSFDFLIAAGKYFYYEHVWETSHELFESAAKLRPTLFEPSYYALQAWIYMQIVAAKPVPTEAYQKKIKGYVENMLKSKDIRPAQKQKVMTFLAQTEARSSRIYTARTMLERAAALNPGDINSRLQLGALEEKAGRFAEARKNYELALSIKSTDLVAQKKIYANLARLYSYMGERAKLDQLLTKAVALYPKEKLFADLQSQRSPASVKK